MSKFSTIRFETIKEMDNDRIVYVTFKEGEIVNTYQQVNKKLDCITNKYHKLAYTGVTILVSPAEYKRLCSMHEHI
jgi:hypothetical protein